MQDESLRAKKLPELREIASSMGIILPKGFLKKEALLALISGAKPQQNNTEPSTADNNAGPDAQKPNRRGRRVRNNDAHQQYSPATHPAAEPNASHTEDNHTRQNVATQLTEAQSDTSHRDGQQQRRGRRPRKGSTNNAGEMQSNGQAQNAAETHNNKTETTPGAHQTNEEREHHNGNGDAQQDKNFDNRKKNIKNNRREKNGNGFNAQNDFTGIIECTGSLEMVPDGYGFLRSADYNYINSPDDVYVGANQIKQYGLKQGDTIQGTIRPPREGDKFFPLSKILKINGLTPEEARDRIQFEFLTPLFPDEKFNITGPGHNNISNRIVDMFSPIGKGQRALIVAQPKTGKTILLKDLANAIADSHPDVYMIMLLIDERPEEVTDMARSVNAEVIASTFDEQASKHVKVAEMVLEKAKRLVECGHDVVIMLDSITRLARAYNTVQPTSNKILSGGVDAAALHKPKRFFGAARNTEERGSLTIIATALIDTGSKMDEVIFEEFKGTGNMELQLDRKLSNRRIYPAVDITASSTRRDDLLQDKDLQQKMWILRRHLSDMSSIEAMEFVKKHLENTRNNDEFFKMMNQ